MCSKIHLIVRGHGYNYNYRHLQLLYVVNLPQLDLHPNTNLSPHHSDDEIASQLYWASWNGRDREVLELLQRGAPPNSDYYTRVQYGLTPLNRACTDNHLRSAELLIKFGAIVAATDNDGWTPLHSTCFYNRKDATKLLLEHHCPTGEPGC